MTVVGVGSVAALALVAGTAALVFGHWANLSAAQSASAGDAANTLASLLACGCCLFAAGRSTGAARRSWLLFGSTMAMWATGDVLWFIAGLDDDLLLLTHVADPLYLLGLIPVSVGLLLFPVGKWERGAARRLVLDALVLGCALLLVSYLLVLREVVDVVGANWDSIVYGVYPVTDILLAGLAALLVLRTAGRPRVDLVLIGLAFATWTTADNGFALLSARGSDYSHSVVALAYVAGPLFLGVAALVGASSSGREVRTVQRNAKGTLAAMLPDLTALCALALCVVSGLDGWPDWTLAAVTLALTGARQLALTADNHGLRESLESRVAERTEALQRLSDRHQRILESVGEGIMGVDERGCISFVNPAAGRLLGWGPAELLGLHACSTLCTEEHQECPLDMVVAVGDVVTQSEMVYRRRDGTHFPVEITAAPRLGGEGTHGAVVAFRDITERHVVDLMKQEFVSAVSHELRTPLTAIRGSLEMLADGEAGELPEIAKQIVAMADRGTTRLTRLVNDIIDVERLEAGSFSVHPSAQEVAPLVEMTVASLQGLAEQAHVRLVVGAVSGRALCDADRVVQALVNLVGNALKFTPPGGEVHISTTTDDHEVTFAVRDEGRGIPAKDLESIFERFHQVDAADSQEMGGNGLGLTITKSIVERHGGRIWVASEPQVGSTFWFTLPLATPLPGDLQLGTASLMRPTALGHP
ncbi:MAG: sensor signal transduction histidine kinase [Marmoricola sp.]|nr:sensor signal transduction histidine kinase [Marmoricola sp.]